MSNIPVSNTEDSDVSKTTTSVNEDDMPLTMTHNAYMSKERAATYGGTVVTVDHDAAFGE